MKRIISLFLIVTLFVFSSISFVAEETGYNNDDTVLSENVPDYEIEQSTIYETYLDDLEDGDIAQYGEIIPEMLPEIYAQDYINNRVVSPRSSLSSLPSRYDPRDNNEITSVKNQGGRGLCWAFSALAGAEQNLLKTSGKYYDLSENHYNYLTASNSLTGGTNYLAPYYRELDAGGWSENVFSSMIVERGALFENEFPYSQSSTLNNTDALLYTPDIYTYGYDDLRAIYGTITQSVIDNRVAEIKEAVYNNGSCNIYMDFGNNFSDFYDSTKHSLYRPLSETTALNHALCIVGWDDSYSKYNFKHTPNNDGAFIFKNSWGTYSGESGYYYLSYEDYYVYRVELSSVKDVFDEKRYDKIDYHTTYSPSQMSVSYNSNGFYIANIYNVDQVQTQGVVAVGLQTLYDNAEFEIYVNPYNSTLDTSYLNLVYSGTAEKAGYHTFELPSIVNIDSTDGKYAVAVKFLDDGSGSSTYNYIAVENENGQYKPANAGESFYSTTGSSWYDYSNIGKNFYINSYTNYTTIPSDNTFSVKFYKPSNWGNNIHLYAWNNDGAITSSWPGDPMTNNNDRVFLYSNENITGCNFIINDGSNQTNNLHGSGKITVINNSTITRGNEPIEIKFKKPSTWGNDVRIYYYTNDNREISTLSWPGYSMNNIGQSFYTYTITDMDSARVIFTDGTYQYPAVNTPGICVNSCQRMISDGTSYSYENIDNLKILFKKPDTWGDNIYIHIWDTADANTTWPGKKMTLMPGGYYQYTNLDLYNCNAVISDGTSEHKTSDLIDLCGYKTIIGNTVINNAKEDIRITFVKPSDWSAVKVYYYSNDTYEYSPFVWPGDKMYLYQSSSKTYTYCISDMAYANIVFTDGTHQTPAQGLKGYSAITGQHIIYNNGIITYD